MDGMQCYRNEMNELGYYEQRSLLEKRIAN